MNRGIFVMSAAQHDHEGTESYLGGISGLPKGSIQLQNNRRGKEYEIKYVPVTSKDMEIEIPAGSEYEISGNNIDGIIVTVLLSKDDAE